MKFFDDGGGPQVGLAYGPGIGEFVAAQRPLVDYIEIPFEQLRHAPQLASIQDGVPVVLHCASLSVAGFVHPTEPTVLAIAAEAQRTRTPWIGEHLAFVSADGLTETDEATALTYTVCPQMSEETIERVVRNLAELRTQLPAPLILENSPQYFAVPGSTMGMVDFIGEVSRRADVDLLLDLSHFLITTLNTRVDAEAEIDRLPLERVVEIHISGLNRQSGIVWDDHATPAPPQVFALLEHVLQRARPRALTLEYNWSAHFPQPVLLAHIERARALLRHA